MTTIIEDQIERFAPGFKETILAKHTMNTQDMQYYNPNYIGGDINGGVQDMLQHFPGPYLNFLLMPPLQQAFIFAPRLRPPAAAFTACVVFMPQRRHYRITFESMFRFNIQ